ncbi:MAG TPA: tetratricopeptide repeat protein [Acidobacteriota bacterium]|nr:tetratricopeptide repeat protein [Acidobacteriota bacterium]
MHRLRKTTTAAMAVILLILICGPLLAGEKELLNQGKILMFDRKWEEARAVFQKFAVDYSRSSLAPQAYYFMARCLQAQGKDEDALRAYEVFVQKYPSEPFLPAEARNAVVDLAAGLMERGNPAFKNRLVDGLSDAKKEVRYFTALRCSRLNDKSVTSIAIPILRDMAQNEKQRDIADRAQIALLRLDPKYLSKPQISHEPREPREKSGKSQPGDSTRMFHLRVYKEGVAQPAIELNLPVSMAQLAIAALDESAKAEIRKKGIDVDNIWKDLQGLGPTNILTIRDGKNLVKLWIE